MTICSNRQTAYWSSFGSNYSHIKQAIPIDKYLPSKDLEFEGTLFKVPADYDYVLTRIYGNYMVLPPADKREGRHAIDVRFGTD